MSTSALPVAGHRDPGGSWRYLLLASCPPSMRLLVNLAEVSVVANIVVALTAVAVAASLPLSREPINRTVLRTNVTRSIVFEDDKADEQKRDDADTKSN
jgi:hypothetical protein